MAGSSISTSIHLVDSATALVVATQVYARSTLLSPLSRSYATILRDRWIRQSQWVVTECLPIVKSSGAVMEATRKGPTSTGVGDQVGVRFDEWVDPNLVGTRKAVDEITTAALKAGGDTTNATAGMGGLRFDMQSQSTRDYLRDNGFSLLSKKLDATTREQIRNAVIQGIDDGVAYGKIVSKVKDIIKGYYLDLGLKPRNAAGRARLRSTLIVSTELGNAFSQGALSAATALTHMGIQMEKMWLTAHDAKVDPKDCLPNEAEGWILVTDSFPNGSARPLAHPGCRCVLLTRRRIIRKAA